MTLLARGLFAADSFRIEVSSEIYLGQIVPVRVIPLFESKGGGSIPIQFSPLPKGLKISPTPPASNFNVNGPTLFQMSVSSSARALPMELWVIKKGDFAVQGRAKIQIVAPAVRFSVGMLPPRVGENDTRVQVIALDHRGLVVPTFSSNVLLSSSVGVLETNEVPGSVFQNGRAEVVLKFRGTPPTGPVRVSARSGGARGDVAVSKIRGAR